MQVPHLGSPRVCIRRTKSSLLRPKVPGGPPPSEPKGCQFPPAKPKSQGQPLPWPGPMTLQNSCPVESQSRGKHLTGKLHRKKTNAQVSSLSNHPLGSALCRERGLSSPVRSWTNAVTIKHSRVSLGVTRTRNCPRRKTPQGPQVAEGKLEKELKVGPLCSGKRRF